MLIYFRGVFVVTVTFLVVVGFLSFVLCFGTVDNSSCAGTVGNSSWAGCRCGSIQFTLSFFSFFFLVSFDVGVCRYRTELKCDFVVAVC